MTSSFKIFLNDFSPGVLIWYLNFYGNNQDTTAVFFSHSSWFLEVLVLRCFKMTQYIVNTAGSDALYFLTISKLEVLCNND